MKFNFDSPLTRRIVSVIVAVVLFSFVNFENQSRFQSTEPTDGASITSSEIISNLPIEVNIDSERYFVSGIPDAATLRIEGPQAILFQTVATQNFTIATPDLNGLGVGTHSVDLITKGLSSDIKSSVSPGTVNLTIEEKQVKEYEVSIKMNEDLDLAPGYEIFEPSLSQEKVTLSGAASTMDKVEEVVVELSSEALGIKSDILSSAQVLVYDAKGELLDVNATPQRIEILAPVVRTQKELPIVLEEGTDKRVGYSYELSLAPDEASSIIVRGEPEAIAELSNFVINVDFDNLTESSLVKIPINNLPEGIEEADRDEVEVLIEVTKDKSNERTID